MCCFQAVDTLKSFEKKDTKVASTAATNLSFLYNLVSFVFRFRFRDLLILVFIVQHSMCVS